MKIAMKIGQERKKPTESIVVVLPMLPGRQQDLPPVLAVQHLLLTHLQPQPPRYNTHAKHSVYARLLTLRVQAAARRRHGGNTEALADAARGCDLCLAVINLSLGCIDLLLDRRELRPVLLLRSRVTSVCGTTRTGLR